MLRKSFVAAARVGYVLLTLICLPLLAVIGLGIYVSRSVLPWRTSGVGPGPLEAPCQTIDGDSVID